MRREKLCKKTAVLMTACLLAGSAAAADSGASVLAAENGTVWDYKDIYHCAERNVDFQTDCR